METWATTFTWSFERIRIGTPVFSSPSPRFFHTSLVKWNVPFMLSYDAIIQVISYLIIALGPINPPYHCRTRTWPQHFGFVKRILSFYPPLNAHISFDMIRKPYIRLLMHLCWPRGDATPHHSRVWRVWSLNRNMRSDRTWWLRDAFRYPCFLCVEAAKYSWTFLPTWRFQRHR